MPIHGYILLRFRRINQLQSLRLRIDSQQFADGGFRIQFILVLFRMWAAQRARGAVRGDGQSRNLRRREGEHRFLLKKGRVG